MPYEPLHHKYRPQTFAQLVGQEAIAATLSNALRQRRIAPAYLFTGPRGTGKTSSARILAKSLNCLNSEEPTETPCGVCDVCTMIARGSALDVIEIDAASNTGVDNIRELIERAQFAPVQCRYKVYVIDECLTGDSLVLTQDGLVRLDDPAIVGKQALSYSESTGSWEFKPIVRWLDQGEREILEIQTSHRKIKCTENHLIRTDQGWVAARDVREGTKILSPVPAAAESQSTNLEPMGDFVVSPVVISSKAIHPVRNLTASSTSLHRQSPYALSVNADVEKNLTSQSFSNKRAGDLTVSKRIGKSIRTRKTTGSGSSEQKSLSLKQALCRPTSLGSSMAPSSEMAPLVTPIHTAVSPGCIGPTDRNKRIGWSTKHPDLVRYGQNSGLQQTKGTEQPQSAAEPSVILALQKCSIASNPAENRKLSQKVGCLESRQKELLGGTWMMAPLASAHREAPKFNSIRKDTPFQKTTSLLNGSMDWVTLSPFDSTQEPEVVSTIATSLWEQTLQGSGCLTSAPMESPQWRTNLETVVSVRPAGVEPVYDIEVEDNHNFVANGLLVHNCHMLSAAAFNALLKTLEEPPDRVVFVLATTDPQRVLPTIISRCQRFDYRRIPLNAMIDHLGAIAQKESIAIAPPAVELVAQLAQGGLRDAESLLDQLSLLEGEITVEKVWDLVGAVPERDLLALVRAIAQDEGTAVLDQARHLMDRGREPLIVLQNLAGFYRDLLIAKTAGDRRDLVAITQPTWDELCTFAQSVDLHTILAGQQHLRLSEAQIKNTTQPRLWLEITLMGLLPSVLHAQAGSGVAPAAGVRSPQISRPTASAPVPTPAAVGRPAPAPSPPTPSAPAAPAPAPASTPAPAPASPTQPITADDPFLSEWPDDDPPTEAASAVPPAPAAASADVDSANQAVGDRPAPSPTPAAENPEPLLNSEGYAAFQQEKLNQTWQQVIVAMRPFGTQALLKQHGCLLAFDGRMARVGISSMPLMGIAQSKLRNIEAAFKEVFGETIVISLEVGSEAPAATSAQTTAAPRPKPATPITSPDSTPVATVPPGGDRPTAAPPAAALPAEASQATFQPPPLLSDPEPDVPRPWQSEDEVTKAAKSFAQMFNGQIVDLDDEGEPNGQSSDHNSSTKPPPTYNPAIKDEDVPF